MIIKKKKKTRRRIIIVIIIGRQNDDAKPTNDDDDYDNYHNNNVRKASCIISLFIKFIRGSGMYVLNLIQYDTIIYIYIYIQRDYSVLKLYEGSRI